MNKMAAYHVNRAQAVRKTANIARCLGCIAHISGGKARRRRRGGIDKMASIFINSLYLLGSIVALGLGVVMVKAVIDTLRKK